MNRLLPRFIAVLLIPCLIADPTLASAFHIGPTALRTLNPGTGRAQAICSQQAFANLPRWVLNSFHWRSSSNAQKTLIRDTRPPIIKLRHVSFLVSVGFSIALLIYDLNFYSKPYTYQYLFGRLDYFVLIISRDLIHGVLPQLDVLYATMAPLLLFPFIEMTAFFIFYGFVDKRLHDQGPTPKNTFLLGILSISGLYTLARPIADLAIMWRVEEGTQYLLGWFVALSRSSLGIATPPLEWFLTAGLTLFTIASSYFLAQRFVPNKHHTLNWEERQEQKLAAERRRTERRQQREQASALVESVTLPEVETASEQISPQEEHPETTLNVAQAEAIEQIQRQEALRATATAKRDRRAQNRRQVIEEREHQLKNQKAYERGVLAFRNSDYPTAIEILQQIETYQDARIWLAKSQHAQARREREFAEAFDSGMRAFNEARFEDSLPNLTLASVSPEANRARIIALRAIKRTEQERQYALDSAEQATKEGRYDDALRDAQLAEGHPHAPNLLALLVSKVRTIRVRLDSVLAALKTRDDALKRQVHTLELHALQEQALHLMDDENWKAARETFLALLKRTWETGDSGWKLSAYRGMATVDHARNAPGQAQGPMDKARLIALLPEIGVLDRMETLIDRARLLRLRGRVAEAHAQLREIDGHLNSLKPDEADSDNIALWQSQMTDERTRLGPLPEPEALELAWEEYRKRNWVAAREAVGTYESTAAKAVKMLSEARSQQSARVIQERLKPTLIAFYEWLGSRYPTLNNLIRVKRDNSTVHWLANTADYLVLQLALLRKNTDPQTLMELKAWAELLSEEAHEAEKVDPFYARLNEHSAKQFLAVAQGLSEPDNRGGANLGMWVPFIIGGATLALLHLLSMSEMTTTVLAAGIPFAASTLSLEQIAESTSHAMLERYRHYRYVHKQFEAISQKARRLVASILSSEDHTPHSEALKRLFIHHVRPETDEEEDDLTGHIGRYLDNAVHTYRYQDEYRAGDNTPHWTFYSRQITDAIEAHGFRIESVKDPLFGALIHTAHAKDPEARNFLYDLYIREEANANAYYIQKYILLALQWKVPLELQPEFDQRIRNDLRTSRHETIRHLAARFLLRRRGFVPSNSRERAIYYLSLRKWSDAIALGRPTLDILIAGLQQREWRLPRRYEGYLYVASQLALDPNLREDVKMFLRGYQERLHTALTDESRPDLRELLERNILVVNQTLNALGPQETRPKTRDSLRTLFQATRISESAISVPMGVHEDFISDRRSNGNLPENLQQTIRNTLLPIIGEVFLSRQVAARLDPAQIAETAKLPLSDYENILRGNRFYPDSTYSDLHKVIDTLTGETFTAYRKATRESQQAIDKFAELPINTTYKLEAGRYLPPWQVELLYMAAEVRGYESILERISAGRLDLSEVFKSAGIPIPLHAIRDTNFLTFNPNQLLMLHDAIDQLTPRRLRERREEKGLAPIAMARQLTMDRSTWNKIENYDSRYIFTTSYVRKMHARIDALVSPAPAFKPVLLVLKLTTATHFKRLVIHSISRIIQGHDISKVAETVGLEEKAMSGFLLKSGWILASGARNPIRLRPTILLLLLGLLLLQHSSPQPNNDHALGAAA